ncbi:MAG: hypothetical protein OXU27_10510, partial [Candidatus Poribacteria bacterium]|nr:hypothetical protein [Candidatus Poribacteria bacterium]
MRSTSTFLKALYRLFTVLCICPIFLFLDYSIEPDRTLEPKEAVAEETTGGNVEVTRKELYEQTFKALQRQFQSPILDEEFEILHQIIRTSPIYLDFLRNVYPNVPHQSFKTFVKASVENSPPNAELYRGVLKKHFGEAMKEELIIMHRMHQAFQSARILIYHGADKTTAEEKILLPVFQEGPIFEWGIKRLQGNDKIIESFGEDFDRLSLDIEQANIEKINKVLKDRRTEQRPDDGFIWLMLTEPVLMGEVLESFTNTEIFLKWLKGEFKEP